MIASIDDPELSVEQVLLLTFDKVDRVAADDRHARIRLHRRADFLVDAANAQSRNTETEAAGRSLRRGSCRAPYKRVRRPHRHRSAPWRHPPGAHRMHRLIAGSPRARDAERIHDIERVGRLDVDSHLCAASAEYLPSGSAEDRASRIAFSPTLSGKGLVVGRAGLEPATNGLKVQCSTN